MWETFSKDELVVDVRNGRKGLVTDAYKANFHSGSSRCEFGDSGASYRIRLCDNGGTPTNSFDNTSRFLELHPWVPEKDFLDESPRYLKVLKRMAAQVR